LQKGKSYYSQDKQHQQADDETTQTLNEFHL
jgi:hypothetical protein